MTIFKSGAIELREMSGEWVIDSRVAATGLDLQHASFMKAIHIYTSQLELFGSLRNEIVMTSFVRTDRTSGASQSKFCWLNEDQVHLIAALAQNNERTVAYKTALVQAFRAAQDQLQNVRPSIIKDEKYWHNLILEYSNYSSLKFQNEVILDNPLNSEDRARSRRINLLRLTPRAIQAWELKARQVTDQDRNSTIAAKGYISLLAMKYPGRPIHFRFLSPFGISESARRLLDLIGAEKSYKDIVIDGQSIRCKIGFEPLSELAGRIKTDSANVLPKRTNGRLSDMSIAISVIC